MSFLDEYRASRAAGHSTSDASPSEVVRDWLTSRPGALFDDLREHAPTLVIGRMAFVTRFGDVLDVLRHQDIFSVQPYGEAITRINRGDNFLMGMDDGPEYQRDLSVLHQVVRRQDGARIGEIASARIAEALAPALAEGRLDLTDGFGRLVAARFVADYFGVPGPDPDTLAKWARTIFTDGFINVLRLPLLHRRAMKASAEFRTHLDTLIADTRTERARGVMRDDVLGRLVTLEAAGEPGVSDGRIRDILLWCVAGMIDNVNIAVCSAIDYLLGHPDVMGGAVEAARADDETRLRTFVLEALRFHTPTPFATRLSLREYTLSNGTGEDKTIPAGTLTFVGLGAAMMDGAVVESPKDFRLDRPEEQYLHFGAGLHQCLGRHIAEALVVKMVGGLLTLDGLRRAKGVTGRLRRIGLFPKAFYVEFSRSGPGAR